MRLSRKQKIKLQKIVKGFEYHTESCRYFAILEMYAGKSNVYCLIQERIATSNVSIIGREIPLALCREVIARKECRHQVHKRREGPRVPMRWGTGPTEICECGAWRNTLHTTGPWILNEPYPKPQPKYSR